MQGSAGADSACAAAAAAAGGNCILQQQHYEGHSRGRAATSKSAQELGTLQGKVSHATRHRSHGTEWHATQHHGGKRALTCALTPSSLLL